MHCPVEYSFAACDQIYILHLWTGWSHRAVALSGSTESAIVGFSRRPHKLGRQVVLCSGPDPILHGGRYGFHWVGFCREHPLTDRGAPGRSVERPYVQICTPERFYPPASQPIGSRLAENAQRLRFDQVPETATVASSGSRWVRDEACGSEVARGAAARRGSETMFFRTSGLVTCQVGESTSCPGTGIAMARGFTTTSPHSVDRAGGAARRRSPRRSRHPHGA